MKIAGLMTVKNYSDECSAFAALKEMVDYTIVLDHNSEVPFPYQNECDEYLLLRQKGLWQDNANRTMLMYRAFAAGCTWALVMDDDMIFSHTLQTRDDLHKIVLTVSELNLDVGSFMLRDLWDSVEQYRCDGVWAKKGFRTIRRNWFGYPRITLIDPRKRRLHTDGFPILERKKTNKIFSEFIVYHTGCLTDEKRRKRVAKYSVEDPGSGAYQYMLSVEGALFKPVPPEDLAAIRRRMRISS